jgi:hypothetical protein
MTVLLDADACESPVESSIPALTAAQLTVVREAVALDLGELSVQFRHATPFTSVRIALRERLAALRTVLASDTLTPTTAATVIEVLTDRVEHVHSQHRRCDTPRFDAELWHEEADLVAIVEALQEFLAA